MFFIKFKKGYSIATIIIIVSLMMFTASMGLVWVRFYLNLTALKLTNIGRWEGYFKIYDEKIKKAFTENYEETASPHSGWFKDLPREADGYEISYSCEDAKIDINNIDFMLFFNHNNKEPVGANKYFGKKTDKTVYSINELVSYAKNPDDKNTLNELDKIFTVYGVPSVNLCPADKIKQYLTANYNAGSGADGFVSEINAYRKNLDYLKFKGAAGKKGGLIIDDFEFDNLRKFKLSDGESLSGLFDYKGRINLNFVNEEVFELAYKAVCEKGDNYKLYWSRVKAFQESGRTIGINDMKNIFQAELKTVEKIFSVNSFVIKVCIIKDDRAVTMYIRRYRDRDVNLKILKISAGKYEQK